MGKSFYITGLAIVATSVSALAQYSATLPEPGQFLITPSALYQTADTYWAGTEKVGVDEITGADSLDQYSYFLNLEYGLTRRFALDASIGYSEAGLDGGSKRDGLSDSRLGLRYNIAAEGADWSGPTVSLRAGAIIAGDYEEGDIDSIGDGASGWEVSLLGEKSVFENVGVYGDFGFRQRENDVPDALFGGAGVYVSAGSVTASAGWRFDNSLDGGDIGGAGFGESFGLPQVEEDDHSIVASLGFTDQGGRSYTLFGSHTLDGKNTAEKDIFGLSITLPFGGKGSSESGGAGATRFGGK